MLYFGSSRGRIHDRSHAGRLAAANITPNKALPYGDGVPGSFAPPSFILRLVLLLLDPSTMQQIPLTNVSLSSLVNQRRRQEMKPVEEPWHPCHDESCCDGMVDNVMAAATTTTTTTTRLERHVQDAATIQIITSNHKTTGRNKNLMALPSSFLQQQQQQDPIAPPRPYQPDEQCAVSSAFQEETAAQTCWIKTTLDDEDGASNDDNDHEKADKIRHCSTLAPDETHCPALSFVTTTPHYSSLPHTLQRNVQEAFAGSNKLKTRHPLCSRVQRIRSCRLAAATNKSKQYGRSLAPLHATTTATSSDTMMMIVVDDNNNGKENQTPPSTFSR